MMTWQYHCLPAGATSGGGFGFVLESGAHQSSLTGDDITHGNCHRTNYIAVERTSRERFSR